MTFNQAQIACHRFGLGAKPAELRQAVKMGAKQFLLQQINNYQAAPAPLKQLESSTQLLKYEGEILRKIKQVSDKIAKQKIRKTARQYAQEIYLKSLSARFKQAAQTDQSFNERLVYFWQNHFAVSAQKQSIRHLAATLENESIRQNLMGKFGDMLLSVTMHPAMQIYLDNFKSIGPDSPKGKKNKKGLNENLAREILELHTLGVNGGYSQQDVIALANMLTGWGVDKQKKYSFKFSKNAHQNQTAKFLGKNYSAKGIKQAKAALAFLATHQNTAKFIATKLAQHFAGSLDPKLTQSLVQELQNSFLKTGGELKPLYEILINHPACWQADAVRFRTPNEWLIAVLRSADIPQIKPKKLVGGLRNMGQQPYFVTSPAGWPDDDNFWNSPSSFIQRWQYAKQLAKASKNEPKRALAISLGKNLDEHTELAMQKSKRKKDKLTLLFLSSQMQYR